MLACCVGRKSIGSRQNGACVPDRYLKIPSPGGIVETRGEPLPSGVRGLVRSSFTMATVMLRPSTGVMGTREIVVITVALWRPIDGGYLNTRTRQLLSTRHQFRFGPSLITFLSEVG
jgi:hypothetical protein